MGYRMEYGSWNKGVVYKSYGAGKKKFLFLLLIPALILCGLHKDKIINYLLPGDPVATKKAIITFVDEVKEGERVTDAFSSFCKVILDEADVS